MVERSGGMAWHEIIRLCEKSVPTRTPREKALWEHTSVAIDFTLDGL
jgi:hypothetical protein